MAVQRLIIQKSKFRRCYMYAIWYIFVCVYTYVYVHVSYFCSYLWYLTYLYVFHYIIYFYINYNIQSEHAIWFARYEKCRVLPLSICHPDPWFRNGEFFEKRTSWKILLHYCYLKMSCKHMICSFPGVFVLAFFLAKAQRKMLEMEIHKAAAQTKFMRRHQMLAPMVMLEIAQTSNHAVVWWWLTTVHWPRLDKRLKAKLWKPKQQYSA